MKATIEFRLPEEQNEFQLAINASNWYCIVWDFDQILRNLIKYNSPKYSEEILTALEDMRNELHKLIDYHGVKME